MAVSEFVSVFVILISCLSLCVCVFVFLWVLVWVWHCVFDSLAVFPRVCSCLCLCLCVSAKYRYCVYNGGEGISNVSVSEGHGTEDRQKNPYTSPNNFQDQWVLNNRQQIRSLYFLIIMTLTKFAVILLLLFFIPHVYKCNKFNHMRSPGGREQLIQSMRALKALKMIKLKDCKLLVAAHNCTLLKGRAPHEMHVYMSASKHGKVASSSSSSSSSFSSKLSVRLVRKHRDSFRGMHAVVVIDPFPEAHFGHTVLVMLVRHKMTKEECRRRNGLRYMQGEFAFLSYKFYRCLQNLHHVLWIWKINLFGITFLIFLLSMIVYDLPWGKSLPFSVYKIPHIS